MSDSSQNGGQITIRRNENWKSKDRLTLNPHSIPSYSASLLSHSCFMWIRWKLRLTSIRRQKKWKKKSIRNEGQKTIQRHKIRNKKFGRSEGQISFRKHVFFVHVNFKASRFKQNTLFSFFYSLLFTKIAKFLSPELGNDNQPTWQTLLNVIFVLRTSYYNSRQVTKWYNSSDNSF